MGRFLVLLLLVAACSSEAATTTSPDTTASPNTASNTTAESATTTESAPRSDIGKPFVGFSLSPAAFDEQGINEFFEVASRNGSLIAWVGAWPQIAQGGDLVSGLSSQFDYVPVAVTGFPTGADQLREVPDDPTEMIETVAAWVGESRVPYFGFGVEINSFLEEKASEDFRWFVAVFPEVVAAVHEVSPETKVFPVFQLERLRGLRGGLFGGETVAPQWELIDLFPEADAIGFTSYPGLIFPRPDDMPADYYSEILSYTDKPIVFTEVGWQAGGDLGEWSGTEAKQAEFISERVAELAEMAEMVIWSFLWDQNAAPPPFDTMGLIDDAGQRRPGFEAWQQLFG